MPSDRTVEPELASTMELVLALSLFSSISNAVTRISEDQSPLKRLGGDHQPGNDLTFCAGNAVSILANTRTPSFLSGFRASGSSTRGRGGFSSGWKYRCRASGPLNTFRGFRAAIVCLFVLDQILNLGVCLLCLGRYATTSDQQCQCVYLFIKITVYANPPLSFGILKSSPFPPPFLRLLTPPRSVGRW